MSNTLLTENLSAPLDGATTAKVDIDGGTGNLTIDQIPGGGPALARGTLQYFEKQGRPARSVSAEHGRATLTLKAGRTGRPWFWLPWAACSGGTEWQIHLNPQVAADLTAHAAGGNVKLDLAGLAVTRLAADTGGGNVEVALPDHTANLNVAARTGGGNVTVVIGSDSTGSNSVTASSGAGNVMVRVPRGLAAKVHAASGLGRVTVEPRFGKVDGQTYQSPDYPGAVDKVEVTVHSGAGNVSVTTQ